MPTIEEALLNSIDAIKRDDINVARQGLARIIKIDPQNIRAWLLMAEIVEDRSAKIDCYLRVYRLDPENAIARRNLEDLEYPTKIDAPSAPSDSDKIEVKEESQDPVKYKLDLARQELLDLGMFNKLLNYRPLKTKGVEIIDEIPVEVFRILVSKGRPMSFLPISEEEAKESGRQAQFLEEEYGIDEGLDQPEDDEDKAILRHTDNKLQTPYISRVLQKRLLKTYYTARTYIEEQGVNILYLALGMLHWYESHSSDIIRKAPLILIPVVLSRTNVHSRFRLRFTEEEIGENLSLRAKLISDFGIKLPDFPDSNEIDINSYFQEVSEVIKSYSRWEVDSKAIILGFFSFGKFLMFNDLDSKNWSDDSKPENNYILRGLLHDGFEKVASELDTEMEIDEQISPNDIHHVVDADSSQTMAIFEVIKGGNLVIQDYQSYCRSNRTWKNSPFCFRENGCT